MFRNTNLLTKRTLQMAQGYFAGLCVTEYEMNEKATPLELSHALEEVRAFLLTYKTEREEFMANQIISELVDVLALNATSEKLKDFHFNCSGLAFALTTVTGFKKKRLKKLAKDNGMSKFGYRMYLIARSLTNLNKELNARGIDTGLSIDIVLNTEGEKICAETTN